MTGSIPMSSGTRDTCERGHDDMIKADGGIMREVTFLQPRRKPFQLEMECFRLHVYSSMRRYCRLRFSNTIEMHEK